MKIFISNRDYVTWPSAMAEKLANEGHEVIFIDSASTWEPLLDWYETCPYKVVKQENLGPRSIWGNGCLDGVNEPFVLTDADYDLSMIPSDWDKVLLEGLSRFPHMSKVGFSWEEHRVPQENPAWVLDNFCNHPNGLPMTWGNKLPNNFLGYACDTSFAVYRPGRPFVIDGVRKGRPYTGVHLPWHVVLDPPADPTKFGVIMDDEIAYYFKNCGGLSFTKARLAGMVEEYYRRKDENGS